MKWKSGLKEEMRQVREKEEINYDLLEKSMVDQDKHRLDDVTWNDLEMDQVYYKLNRTYTLPGEEVLYQWLRQPTTKEEELDHRRKQLKEVRGWPRGIGKDLDKVGHFKQVYRQVIREAKTQEKSYGPLICYSLIFLSICLFVLSKFALCFVGIIGGMIGLLVIHYSFEASNKYKIENYAYILKIVSFYLKYTRICHGFAQSDQEARGWDRLAGDLVKHKGSLTRIEGLNPLVDIGAVFSLSLYKDLRGVENLVKDHKEDLVNLISAVGHLDMIMSVQAYQATTDHLCQARLKDDKRDLQIQEGSHILIPTCVKNSMNLGESIVITGSNMGGKSSFLRMIGVNTVLAQALGFCHAKSYQGGFFKILSSISLKDDIQSGKSYFMREAEAIHRMIQGVEADDQHLLLIDEIFKGTNPSERLAASVEILNLLASRARVMVTTHDIGILPDLEGYKFYHFEHHIDRNRMDFDYVIREGITEVRNAIKLMTHIRYPAPLIKKINDRIG